MFFVFFKIGEDDPHIYPTHLDKLLGLQFAFRAKYHSRYQLSSVLGFSCNPAVIEKIKAHLHPDGMEPEVIEPNQVCCACFAFYLTIIQLFKFALFMIAFSFYCHSMMWTIFQISYSIFRK